MRPEDYERRGLPNGRPAAEEELIDFACESQVAGDERQKHMYLLLRLSDPSRKRAGIAIASKEQADSIISKMIACRNRLWP